MSNSFEEKIIFDSLGMTDSNEKESQENLSANLTDEQKKDIAEFNNTVALFPKLLNKLSEMSFPPENLKEKILDKIKGLENKPKEDFSFSYFVSDDWVQHPEVEGIKIRQLAHNKDKGYIMILMNVAAGTVYPSHHHHGAEECYVLEGDLYAQGKTLGAGDFHHAEGGSNHEPLSTKNGCRLLLVIDPEDF